MSKVEKSRSRPAKWDALANKVFVEICVQEWIADNKKGSCLSNKGYANLIGQFNERTGRNYTHGQLKNRWDVLKGEYVAWKTLNLNASGLGKDPKTGTIDASDEWWDEKIEAQPAFKKFRHAGLEFEDELDILFSNGTCTNESAAVAGVDDLHQDAAINLDDETPEDHVVERAKKRVVAASPPKKTKKNFRDQQFKRFVDSWVDKASSSKSSATSTANDVVRTEIAEMLDEVIQAGAPEMSDDHFYATQLLIKKEYRDVFATLKTPEGKLAFLRRTWEERKKR